MKEISSLQKKRLTLIANGIIKADTVDNIRHQEGQTRGFALNLCGHCTFRCSYCPQSLEQTLPEYIPQAAIDRLLEDTRLLPTYFQFGTRGENLLHPDFDGIFRALKRANPLHYLTLNTNGVLMEGGFARRVLESGLDQLIFSLQSIDPEVYTSLTNYQDHGRIMANILETIAMRDKAGLDVMIGVQYLDTQANRPHREAFERFWEDYPVYTYSQRLHSWGDKFEFSTEAPPERYPCLALWLYPSVSHTGDVCSCFADFYGQCSYGSLLTTSLGDIWTRSPLRRHMMEQHLLSNWDNLPLCGSCNGWTEFPNVFVKTGSGFALPKK